MSAKERKARKRAGGKFTRIPKEGTPVELRYENRAHWISTSTGPSLKRTAAGKKRLVDRGFVKKEKE